MSDSAVRINAYAYGCIEIVVHRPMLDDDERRKREATIRRAVAAYGKETMKRRSENHVQNR